MFDMDKFGDLNKFKDWVKDSETRSVKIELSNRGSTIFVYDREIREGQLVNSVDEIDLETKAKEEKIKEFEKLKKELGINE